MNCGKLQHPWVGLRWKPLRKFSDGDIQYYAREILFPVAAKLLRVVHRRSARLEKPRRPLRGSKTRLVNGVRWPRRDFSRPQKDPRKFYFYDNAAGMAWRKEQR